MSEPGDGFRALSQPLRWDVPIVRDSYVILNVRPRSGSLQPAAVLDALAANLDEAPGLGTLHEYTQFPGPDERGHEFSPPCRHVARGATYRAFPVVEHCRIEVGPGVSVEAHAKLGGCELCVPLMHVLVPEEQIRAAWWKLHGRVEGDEELRPWRVRHLVEPRLKVLAERLVVDSPMAEVRLGWGDRRGTMLDFEDGVWTDISESPNDRP